MTTYVEPLVKAILDKEADRKGKELLIYLDDRYYYQLKKEMLEQGLPETDFHLQTIMGYKYYRVSPNDNHPDFRIVVEDQD